ncbi:MAG: phenylalanine--tRNA ligase subunit alpha [Firmicutes bacterium]|nr:phenylalanine--tRNA ligase subunit alpha [Bacillota bacterium]
MRLDIEVLRQTIMEAIEKAGDPEALEEVRRRYLGRKGELTMALRALGELPPPERPRVGERLNALKVEVEEALTRKGETLARAMEEARLMAERVDVLLPGRRPRLGYGHPIRLVWDEIEEIFLGMGFTIAEGPEIELDRYNFEALNFPPEHPARDMQDSFYITSTVLLRTHTSPVQVRTMEALRPAPIRIIAPGRVYRRDAPDASHSLLFHQVEGLVVDEGITFADLKGTLVAFARAMFGSEREVSFRPSFFPFTEPSAEVYISCSCGKGGCRVCKGSGWLEILGAGAVHPNVLAVSGYDPERFTGFAFGMGVERIALLKYGIEDMRLLFENDLRFLAQFAAEGR